MIFTSIILGLLFIGIPFIVTKNNAKYLLAGYNTMSEQERQRFDLKSFLYFFKKFNIVLGGSLILICILISKFIGNDAAGLFLLFYPLAAYVYFILRTRKFYTSNSGGKTTKLSLFIMALVTIPIVILLFNGLKENKFLIKDEVVEITGMYGEVIKLKDIKDIEVLERLPAIVFKTNGFALGERSKGYFKTKDKETVKLLVNSKSGPYLYLLTNDNKKIYYSSANMDENKIYSQLRNKQK